MTWGPHLPHFSSRALWVHTRMYLWLWVNVSMWSCGSAVPVSRYLQKNFISIIEGTTSTYSFNKFSFSCVKFVILLIEFGVKCSKSNASSMLEALLLAMSHAVTTIFLFYIEMVVNRSLVLVNDILDITLNSFLFMEVMAEVRPVIMSMSRGHSSGPRAPWHKTKWLEYCLVL